MFRTLELPLLLLASKSCGSAFSSPVHAPIHNATKEPQSPPCVPLMQYEEQTCPTALTPLSVRADRAQSKELGWGREGSAPERKRALKMSASMVLAPGFYLGSLQFVNGDFAAFGGGGGGGGLNILGADEQKQQSTIGTNIHIQTKN
ncbi:hypothetical protein Leryth_022937 [Lithospermum erythrorhizon]|nr:hypothetical protein Leryth_022937 [Lithospermum erythrorhizon]